MYSSLEKTIPSNCLQAGSTAFISSDPPATDPGIAKRRRVYPDVEEHVLLHSATCLHRLLRVLAKRRRIRDHGSEDNSRLQGAIPVPSVEPEFEKFYKVPMNFSAFLGKSVGGGRNAARGSEGVLGFCLSFPNLFQVTTDGLEPCVKAKLPSKKLSSPSNVPQAQPSPKPQLTGEDDELDEELTDIALNGADLPKETGIRTLASDDGNPKSVATVNRLTIPKHVRRFEVGAAEKFTALALNLISEEKPIHLSIDEKYAEFEYVEEFVQSLGGMSKVKLINAKIMYFWGDLLFYNVKININVILISIFLRHLQIFEPSASLCAWQRPAREMQ